MYVHTKSFRLIEPTEVEGNFFIDPKGVVEVDLPKRHAHFEAKFEQLDFVPDSLGCTKVRCHGEANMSHWQISLKNCDALCLRQMIDDAQDDMEELMREL